MFLNYDLNSPLAKQVVKRFVVVRQGEGSSGMSVTQDGSGSQTSAQLYWVLACGDRAIVREQADFYTTETHFAGGFGAYFVSLCR